MSNNQVSIPSNYSEAATIQDKVLFALSDLEQGTAVSIIQRLEQLEPAADTKALIAAAHEALANLHQHNLIIAEPANGDLVYRLK